MRPLLNTFKLEMKEENHNFMLLVLGLSADGFYAEYI